MAHTRSILDRPATSTLTVSSFDRARVAQRPQARRAAAPAAAAGRAALRDPRADLRMFDLAPAARPIVPVAVHELAPLLPPVISDPPRARAPQVASDVRRRPARVAADRTPAPSPTRRARLTRRGYTAVMGIIIGSIAATSALTLAQADGGPSVAPTQAVVRSGESVEQVATRVAQGRDVAEVAAAIRLANDLPADAALQTGEIVVVPGS